LGAQHRVAAGALRTAKPAATPSQSKASPKRRGLACIAAHGVLGWSPAHAKRRIERTLMNACFMASKGPCWCADRCLAGDLVDALGWGVVKHPGTRPMTGAHQIERIDDAVADIVFWFGSEACKAGPRRSRGYRRHCRPERDRAKREEDFRLSPGRNSVPPEHRDGRCGPGRLVVAVHRSRGEDGELSRPDCTGREVRVHGGPLSAGRSGHAGAWGCRWA